MKKVMVEPKLSSGEQKAQTAAKTSHSDVDNETSVSFWLHTAFFGVGFILYI